MGGQDTGAPDAPPAGPWGELDQALAAIARQTGATLRIYPRPSRAARRLVLRNDRDDRGTRYEDAALEQDGTLRITGHDQGPRVSEFWGDAIISYEWSTSSAATGSRPSSGSWMAVTVTTCSQSWAPPPARGRADQRPPQPPRRDSTLQQLAQLTGNKAGLRSRHEAAPWSAGVPGLAQIQLRAP